MGGLTAVKSVDNFLILESGSIAGFSVWNRVQDLGLDKFQSIGFSQAETSPFAGTFQIAASGSNTSPFRFTEAGTSSVGENLPVAISWTPVSSRTFFAFEKIDESNITPLTKAPDWGAGSYLGFRARPTISGTAWNYGYFEVTWNAASAQFQILSGAYESTVNTPITVPEPAGMVLAGIGALALGVGAIRRSRMPRRPRSPATTARTAAAR